MATPASRGRGRPPKKTDNAMARIIEVAKMGLPLHFAARAGDITDEALMQWWRKDPQFVSCATMVALRKSVSLVDLRVLTPSPLQYATNQ